MLLELASGRLIDEDTPDRFIDETDDGNNLQAFEGQLLLAAGYDYHYHHHYYSGAGPSLPLCWSYRPIPFLAACSSLSRVLAVLDGRLAGPDGRRLACRGPWDADEAHCPVPPAPAQPAAGHHARGADPGKGMGG